MDGSDYVGQSNMGLTFNATTRNIEVEVELIDDSVYETEEGFSGTLALVSDSPRVTIGPNAHVTIMDDESKMSRSIVWWKSRGLKILSFLMLPTCLLNKMPSSSTNVP